MKHCFSIHKNALCLKSVVTALAVMAVAVLCASLAACSDELLLTNGTESTGEYFVIGGVQNMQTRVAYTDDSQSVFEIGDEVGVFALNSDGAPSGSVQNVPYVVRQMADLQVLQPKADGSQVPHDANLDYVFYYPYDKTMTADKLSSMNFSVMKDQSTTDAYEASDLLFCKTRQSSDNKVHVIMQHAMANIILKIDHSLVKEGSDVLIPSSPITANGVSLLTGADYSTDQNSGADIKMLNFGTDDNGVTTYRAAVPACRTLKAYKQGESENFIFQLTTPDGVTRRYPMPEDMTLEQGKNYIFQVRNGADIPIPLTDDNDSWVYNVINNGKVVGLLCREYLRYQDSDKAKSGNTDSEYDTGTPTGDGKSKNINSQAWVLYQVNNGVPNLDEGIVVRFLYDIKRKWAKWPLPHRNHEGSGGLFTPDHGYDWSSTGSGDNAYGANSLTSQEYYMHGGTIKWDAKKDEIKSFTMPKTEITNRTAKFFGHVIYDGKKAKVSYEASDKKEEYKCKLEPRFLKDTRGSVTKPYPLVKIGYNQFWMSKSLEATALNDGTPLECFNKKGGMGVTFVKASDAFRRDKDGNAIDHTRLGYLYPFSKIGDHVYDPYNNSKQMKYEFSTYTNDGKTKTFTPVPLYNRIVINNEKFLPVVPADEAANVEYIMPSATEFKKMDNYFGVNSSGKLFCRYLIPYAGDKTRYGKFEAALRGEICDLNDVEAGDDTNANAFTANISGFNLRPLGYFSGDNSSGGNYYQEFGEVGKSSISALCSLILKDSSDNQCTLFIMNSWDMFKNGDDIDKALEPKVHDINSRNIDAFFSQVRFVMRFKNQSDTKTKALTRSSFTSDDEADSGTARNVYITLDNVGMR